MGLDGNLTSGEIIEQLMIARSYEKIRNVVFMVRLCIVCETPFSIEE